MTVLTRRDLLQAALAAGAGALVHRPLEAAAPKVLGVQLYSVRDQMTKDPEATLKAIADIGYKEVEVLGGTLKTVGPLARRLGLSPVSVHVETPLITGNWDAWQFMRKSVPEGYGLDDVIGEAKEQGAKYLVLSYLMASERGGGVEYYTRLADTLNRVGEQIRNAGLQFCYHNHGFEFEPFADGRLPLDVLMASTKPELVKLELDVFWVGITGNDPVKFIERYDGRIALLHLKDKSKAATIATQESKVPPAAFSEVGFGALDFPAILTAASAAGVEHYFVEQDHSAGNPIDSLRKSFEYLRKI